MIKFTSFKGLNNLIMLPVSRILVISAELSNSSSKPLYARPPCGLQLLSPSPSTGLEISVASVLGLDDLYKLPSYLSILT